MQFKLWLLFHWIVSGKDKLEATITHIFTWTSSGPAATTMISADFHIISFLLRSRRHSAVCDRTSPVVLVTVPCLTLPGFDVVPAGLHVTND